MAETTEQQLRKEQRRLYCYRLSVTRERDFGRGELLDWSPNGMQVLSSIPLENAVTYRIRLHVERDLGLLLPKARWSVEGSVRWVERQSDGWHLGIQLDTPLESLEFMEEDFCYLFLMPAIVQTAALSP